MSTCKYCGKDAGLLRSAHKECLKLFEDGSKEVVALLTASARGKISPDIIERDVRNIAARSYIDDKALRATALSCYESAINLALNDDLLTEQEEEALSDFQTRYALVDEQIYSNPAYIKLVKAAVLRDLIEGRLPERVTINGQLPINFQKSERVVWVFQDVEYLQPRTKTTYEGKSSGVSLRITKGVYYRVGQFKGNPVQTTQIVLIDIGLLAVTDKHLYFVGQTKSLKIRFDKIITFQPYSDAISISRDGIAKPDIFKTEDGWFTYNLLTNLVQAI